MKSENQKQNNIDNSGKLPPQATDVEEMVLGQLMLERNALTSVISLLSADVFYKPSHSLIYSAIISLYDNNLPIDILTVSNQLRKTSSLDMAGGAFYITQLTSRVASSANILSHVAILQQKYLARLIIAFCGELGSAAYSDETDIFDLLDTADILLSKINDSSMRGGSMSHISSAITKSFHALEARVKANLSGLSGGISTGLYDLNQLTGGWQKSFVTILAARPGMGKTALMLHFVRAAAFTGANCCIFSLEMSEESLADRMILSLTDILVDNYKKGIMFDSDWLQFNEAKKKLSALPIYIDPNPSVSMRYIKTTCRLMKKKGKCDIIFLDYLQLVDMSLGEKNKNRENEVSQASRNCKIIAKELNVPVIVLAQLSRKVEERKGNRPELADLRESGAIEQDADIVGFIYRPEYYKIETDSAGNSTAGLGELIIAKHRDGPTGDIPFRCNESLTKFSDFVSAANYQFPSTSKY